MARDLPRLLQMPDRATERRLLTEQLEAVRPVGGELQILEAGCGQKWPLQLDNIHLTGLDLDSEALRIRRETVGDLDESIHGDLSNVSLEDGHFDAVYCAFVLEHIPHADTVLKKLVECVRPGGIVIIKVPDPESVRGAVTRLTPHWFHVWYWRYIIRYPHAGEPGYSPYPTFYHAIISRQGLREQLVELGAEMISEQGDSRFFGDAPGLRGKMIAAVVRGVAWLSRGRLKATHDNLLYILRRTQS